MPSLMVPDDEQLLAAARGGDRDAFGVLFDRYRDYAFAIAFDILRSEPEACDVTQDAFVKVLTRIHQVRSGSRLRAWLARIVVHEAIDVVRRRGRAPSIDADVITADAGMDAARREEHRRVRSAVRALTPRLRAAVLLRYVAGWSYARIARRLGVSMGTVASRLSRAHDQLRERLEAAEGGGS